jgi:hypothetical protein
VRLAAGFPTHPASSSWRPRGARHLFSEPGGRPLQGSKTRYRVATESWVDFGQLFFLWPAQPAYGAQPTRRQLQGSDVRFPARTPTSVSRPRRGPRGPDGERSVRYVVGYRLGCRPGSSPPPHRRKPENRPRYRVAAERKDDVSRRRGGPRGQDPARSPARVEPSCPGHPCETRNACRRRHTQ